MKGMKAMCRLLMFIWLMVQVTSAADVKVGFEYTCAKEPESYKDCTSNNPYCYEKSSGYTPCHEICPPREDSDVDLDNCKAKCSEFFEEKCWQNVKTSPERPPLHPAPAKSTAASKYSADGKSGGLPYGTHAFIWVLLALVIIILLGVLYTNRTKIRACCPPTTASYQLASQTHSAEGPSKAPAASAVSTSTGGAANIGTQVNPAIHAGDGAEITINVYRDSEQERLLPSSPSGESVGTPTSADNQSSQPASGIYNPAVATTPTAPTPTTSAQQPVSSPQQTSEDAIPQLATTGGDP